MERTGERILVSSLSLPSADASSSLSLHLHSPYCTLHVFRRRRQPTRHTDGTFCKKKNIPAAIVR